MSALRIGALRLTDSAPVIVAHEFGFFAEEGVEATLSIEPSWANVADKLAYGALDAAAMLPPLAFAVTLGARGAAEPLIAPFALSTGGNTITLVSDLAARVRAAARGPGAMAALAAALKGAPGATLGVVHEYSSHSLLLRYGLAAEGAEAGRDYQLAVVPPARSVEALRTGRIVGFCAGSPWGELAARARVGATVATSHDIWRHAPEKVFAVRERFADEAPDALDAALRGLHRAAQFCDAPENASYVASLLSRRAYLDVDSHAILSSLPGAFGGRARSGFFSGAATFPWRSQALWFLAQMRRWGLIEAAAPLREIATRVYRPDLYARALAPVGAAIPESAWKREGGHDGPWTIPATPAPLAMPADLFCDGATFDPNNF